MALPTWVSFIALNQRASLNNGSKTLVLQLSGNICPSRTAFMPSSITSLVSLRFYDQYFLASAMDGSVSVHSSFALLFGYLLTLHIPPFQGEIYSFACNRVMLYDHRLSKRGPIQSYEGHANSHTLLQLAVDQSERFVMAGGEDCNLRIWSIKSGELLFQEKVSDSASSTVSWRLVERPLGKPDEKQSQNELQFAESLRWEAWFGSVDGLYHMGWP
ncbi:hypothetical protein Patl1_11974 [Pistacia atlantica]|uniref:Uncharacterized protein n=1 Tax=Pistacia atlantica TaxID=434234 RepID=A0ACC1A4C9_9ROSI|nr:hypothetical protein Patl1_11974 [Pistacia atlantica]